MPNSHPENKPWIMNEILQINPKTVLDVGVGKGDYLNLIRQHIGKSVKVDAIEVWQPYVDFYYLKKRYDEVFVEDVRKFEDFNYDLVIFGDVLEHMSEEEALEVWDKASKQAKYLVLSIPIIPSPQHDVNSNPYEVHVKEDWTTEEVLEKFKGIYKHESFSMTGAFIARF